MFLISPILPHPTHPHKSGQIMITRPIFSKSGDVHGPTSDSAESSTHLHGLTACITPDSLQVCIVNAWYQSNVQ